MKLVSLDYCQHVGTLAEWSLKGFTLSDLNLIVGKNATGKTKTLNVILGLARLLSGELRAGVRSPINSRRAIGHGTFDARFEHEDGDLRYTLQIVDGKVLGEGLTQGSEELLARGEGGVGTIRTVKNGGAMEFHPPDNELAAFARRDEIQHPFFEPLYSWARSLQHYAFGGPLGRKSLAVFHEREGNGEQAEEERLDPDKVIVTFRKGTKRFPTSFETRVLEDMAKIGYEIEDIGLRLPHNMEVSGSPQAEVVCLSVKELDLRGRTDQTHMSQGMFRALSVIININYSALALEPSCVLIDDIGEGLDYERSCSLIELLMEKARKAEFQLLMATNDRFVMNAVPLEHWTILQRSGGGIAVSNYQNSQSKFDDFKFTGLNNFDLLATDYLNKETETDE